MEDGRCLESTRTRRDETRLRRTDDNASLAFNLLPTRIIITITNPASIIGRKKAGGRPKTDTMARPLLCSFLLRHAFSAQGQRRAQGYSSRAAGGAGERGTRDEALCLPEREIIEQVESATRWLANNNPR